MERVLEEWQRLAFSDLRDVATWGPDGLTVTASDALGDEAAAALSEVIEHRTRRITTRRTAAVGTPGEPGYLPPTEVETVTEERNLRVKLHDKVAALTALSKFLGILSDRGEEAERPILPKGFFAALVLGDVEQIKGYLPEGTPADALPPRLVSRAP